MNLRTLMETESREKLKKKFFDYKNRKEASGVYNTSLDKRDRTVRLQDFRERLRL